MKGDKVGGFYLFNKYGELVARFCHRRLLETPGGISALCESYYHKKALMNGLILLKHLRWKGVAMAEFIIRTDGTPMLLEVNPRFWGSLPLAILAGVDFPRLLVETWDIRDNKPLARYKYVKCLMLTQVLDMLYTRGNIQQKVKIIKMVLNSLSSNTYVFELLEGDIAPFMLWVFKVISKTLNSKDRL